MFFIVFTSERATSTKATGDRLKEGSLINQSLSNLGNCIKALADESMGKKNVIGEFFFYVDLVTLLDIDADYSSLSCVFISACLKYLS